MNWKSSWLGVAAVLLPLVGGIGANWPWGPNLRVDPPRMLFWGQIHHSHSDAYLCEVMRTSEIVEASESQKERAEALNCDTSYGGDWLRYTVFVTWHCPTYPAGQPCSYWKEHIYGDAEPVPDEALLHHLRAGGYSCEAADGSLRSISWEAGEAVDLLHFSPNLCGYYGYRGPGTHMMVNPGDPWTQDAVVRYAEARVAQGYSFARVDEVHRVLNVDFTDLVEYPEASPGDPSNQDDYWQDFADLLASMREVDGWHATCPSQHEFWDEREMVLNRAGGCASTEGFPHGWGIRPNWAGYTIAELRDIHGYKLQNPEAWDDDPNTDSLVPGNMLVAIRYESTERNIRGAAQMVREAVISARPNLYWLMDCSDIVSRYGADLQEAVGTGRDRVMCIPHWGLYRDPATGHLPLWWAPLDYLPTWATP